jgi:hypothetical protein
MKRMALPAVHSPERLGRRGSEISCIAKFAGSMEVIGKGKHG